MQIVIKWKNTFYTSEGATTSQKLQFLHSKCFLKINSIFDYISNSNKTS
jgi:hypothetical protein